MWEGAVGHYLGARDSSYPVDPAGTYTRPRRGRLTKSVHCRGASSRLVDQPWRLMSIRIWQWALWVLISELWYHGPPGATASKIDPADADEDSRASAPNVAVGGVHGPVVEMASTAGWHVFAGPHGSAPSDGSGAGPDTATDDDDAAPADIDFFDARTNSSAAEVVHRAEIRRRAGRVRAGEKIVDNVDHPGASDWALSRRRAGASLAQHAFRPRPPHARSPPKGAPTGFFFFTAGASVFIAAGTSRLAGASPKPSGLNPNGAPAGYYYKAGAATYIEDPAGTYSKAGASAPIADPGGTYSAAGASAPTMDPAGTYSSPYALNRLILDSSKATPATGVLSFNNAAAVANYYGATSFEAKLANEFFAGYGGTSATMFFTRYSGAGDRPHLYGADISNLTLNQLQNISGNISITFGNLPGGGYTYSGSPILAGDKSFKAAAQSIQNALNSHLQPVAQTSGSYITGKLVSFTGSVTGDLLQITSAAPDSIKLGAQISGPGGIPIGQIVTQRTGTSGGPGLYTLFAIAGTVSSEPMTETYGVLTVGSVNPGSGPVAVGQEVNGTGVLGLTAIDGNLSGSGPGSTWLVNNYQTVGSENMTENMTMTPAPLVVNYNSIGGATTKRHFFEIQPNGDFGYDYNQSSLGYMDGTAAAALGLTQASGALLSSTGGASPLASPLASATAYMNNLVQNEYNQFGSFQATWETLAQLDPEYLGDLAAWAQSNGDLYTFLSQSTTTTPPAGSSAAVIDPPGTYSGPGASAPTLAQPGYYVPTAGATSETPDDPGYYTPYPGATEEIKKPSAISGAVAGQTTAFNQTDTPFSAVAVTDPNIDTTDASDANTMTMLPASVRASGDNDWKMLNANGTIERLANPLGSAGETDMTQSPSGRGYAGVRVAPSYFDDNIASGLLLLSPSAAAAALSTGVTAPIDKTGSGLYGDFTREGATEARGEWS